MMQNTEYSNQFFYSKSELHFGFLASSVISNLESDDYQIRRSTIKDLITTVQTTASSQIDVDRFIDYMLKFLDDENIIVAEKSCTVIETLCMNLHGNIALYKNHLLKIAVSQLGSRKKFLYTFGKNILHIMIKSISLQKIVSDLFSMTLMSSSQTITQLFNFISNEINDNIIPPSILIKYGFIFEDALNSDDNNLVDSVRNCLQIIKMKDLNSYQALTQRIKTSYFNSSSTQNIPINNNNKYIGLKIQTSIPIPIIHSPSPDYKRPYVSPIIRHSMTNRPLFSHSTFAFQEVEDIEITSSKPGSADDLKIPTSRVNIGNSNDFDIPQIFDDDGKEDDEKDDDNFQENSIKAKDKDSPENKINKQKTPDSFNPKRSRLLRLNVTKS